MPSPKRRPFPMLFLGCVLALAQAAPLAAAPELLPAKPFDVRITGNVVTMDFTLAWSEAKGYPVTITAISGSTEEVLYEGVLIEGTYRFSAPLKKLSGPGDLRVVLKARLRISTWRGTDSPDVFLRWQGRM